jgi:hypothetical protein
VLVRIIYLYRIRDQSRRILEHLVCEHELSLQETIAQLRENASPVQDCQIPVKYLPVEISHLRAETDIASSLIIAEGVHIHCPEHGSRKHSCYKTYD